jgi:peptide/nickel transport system permease protein
MKTGLPGFLLRRLLQSVLIIAGIAALNFVLLHLAPGDLAEVMAGQGGGSDAGYIAALRAKYGLDAPLPVQFLRYAWALLHLDFGISFRENIPVFTLILDRLGATLILMIGALGLSFTGGILLGSLAARRRGTFADALISVLALLFYATPLFWLGLLMILLFTIQLGWLPSGGMRTIGADDTGLPGFIDVTRHAIMPVVTLALFYMAVFTRLMRASVLEVAGHDFVRTAFAKGMTARQVHLRHVLGNAMLPMVTMLGVQIGTVLGGSVVVETVFGWPGLGRLTFDAVFARDLNLLSAILFLSSVLVVGTNIAVDLVYAWLDPRIGVLR